MTSTFTGVLKIIVVEAKDLDGKPKNLNPFCQLSIDDKVIASTTSKPKTGSPKWEEDFEASSHRGKNLEITVLSKELLGADGFIANVTVPLVELLTENQGSKDVKVLF